MNNDDVRTCAAFIGAILGIINFVWNIIRTVRIGFKYKIRAAKIKGEYEGKYILKIDLQFAAAEKDLYIQKVIIENEKGAFVNDSKELIINKIYDYFEDDDLFLKSYKEIKTEFANNDFHKLQDLKISKGEHKQLSIVETFRSYRNMDGYDPIPRKSYKIIISVNDKIYEKNINLEEARNSDSGEFFG